IELINRNLQDHVHGLQKRVMALQRVPLNRLFSKFPRRARSLAAQLGKKVHVHVSGEETEIDKPVADDLDAPLTHLVRNAVDHGIEMPEERQQRGKDRAGNLWLEAQQSQDQVVIIVRDDGRGIDAERLRAKALQKGIVDEAQAATMSDAEAVELIFHPGLSTATKVSDVSGRGVGMDAVRNVVLRHDGTVDVQSTPHSGTTVRLTIPLRQATIVIDALLVQEAQQLFLLPYKDVHGIARIPAHHFRCAGKRRLVALHGDLYEAPSLHELLDLKSTPHPADSLRSGVIIRSRLGRMFLLVERIIGGRRVVVTSLADVLPQCGEFSSVAHLGNGDLALVLDAQGLLVRYRSPSPDTPSMCRETLPSRPRAAPERPS
ncbi:MAG TPA: chemotaxis protein CheA, partial [Planctomycetaceae bacterium]|nr:chemotaxis protein CheA [Planctomycetaceae bacterium]